MTPSISQLIREHRDRTGDSLRDLSRASSRVSDRGVSHQRWADFESGKFDQFPLPETIRAVSAVLGVDPADVVLGFATALKIPVRPLTSALPLPAGAERLTDVQRRAVWEVVRGYLTTEADVRDGLDGKAP